MVSRPTLQGPFLSSSGNWLPPNSVYIMYGMDGFQW